VENEDDTNQSTFPSGAQDNNPVKASLYEWHVHNDAWLQAVMHTSMNDLTVAGIPTIDHVEHLTRLNTTARISPTPMCPHAVKYDICIKVPKDNGLVNQMQCCPYALLPKIKSVDPLAVIKKKKKIAMTKFQPLPN